jgi:hypothetical protein
MTGWRVSGFEELSTLGEGGQGRAVLVRENASGRAAVLKYVLSGGGLVALDRFRRESVLLKRVQSPYVARWFGHFEHRDGAAILMEAVDCRTAAECADAGGAPSSPDWTVLLQSGETRTDPEHVQRLFIAGLRSTGWRNIASTPRTVGKLNDYPDTESYLRADAPPSTDLGTIFLRIYQGQDVTLTLPVGRAGSRGGRGYRWCLLVRYQCCFGSARALVMACRSASARGARPVRWPVARCRSVTESRPAVIFPLNVGASR